MSTIGANKLKQVSGVYAETVLSTMSLSEINTVLSTVSSDGGGTVAFRNGVYSFSGDLVVPSNVGIIGESFGGTILSFTGNYGINGSGTLVYNTGTVSATKGSNAIVGSGTSWVANLTVGDEILIDGFYYEIASIEDDTNLTITRPYPYASISGTSYVVANPTSSITITDFFITNTTPLAGYGIKLEYNKFSFLRRNAMIAVGEAYTLKDCSIVGLNDTGINLCDIGFDMDNAGSVAIQEVSGDCSTANFDLQDCKRCYISDVGAYSATKGITIDGGYKLSFGSMWVGDNTTGIEIKDSLEVSFNSSFVFGNTTGLTIDADCEDTKIIGTSFDNTTNIVDNGVGTVVSGCTPDTLNVHNKKKILYGETIAVNDAVYMADDGKVYKIDNSDQDKYPSFVGFAKEAGAADSRGLVQTNGVVSGFSGLTKNLLYYISATAGEITKDVGVSNEYTVGLAISDTELEIVKWQFTTKLVFSDELKHSNDTEGSSASTSFVKVKEIKVNQSITKARIKFDLRTGGSTSGGGSNYNVYGRIYKNGAAIGSIKTVNNHNAFITTSEDLTINCVPNDLIQLYVYKENSPTSVRFRNLRIYYSKEKDSDLVGYYESNFENQSVKTMNNELQKEAEKINRDCLTFPNAFMAKIENEISHINKRLDDIPTKSEMMLANEQLLVRALDKADVRYADKNLEGEVKWIKSVVYGLGGLCCLEQIIKYK